MKPYSKDNTAHHHARIVMNLYSRALREKLPHAWLLSKLADHYQTAAYQALSGPDRRYVSGAGAACLNLHYRHLTWYHVTPNGTFPAPLPNGESYGDISESFHGYDPEHRF